MHSSVPAVIAHAATHVTAGKDGKFACRFAKCKDSMDTYEQLVEHLESHSSAFQPATKDGPFLVCAVWIGEARAATRLSLLPTCSLPNRLHEQFSGSQLRC